MTVTLADVASDRIVNHCTSIDAANIGYMTDNASKITGHLDPLRDDATGVLINKYAPFLASRRSFAEKALDPIIRLIIDQFALDEMDAEVCAQMDMTFEALEPLEPQTLADVLTVFMIRGSQMEGGDQTFQVCEAP